MLVMKDMSLNLTLESNYDNVVHNSCFRTSETPSLSCLLVVQVMAVRQIWPSVYRIALMMGCPCIIV
jgi:hypothetical protein